ncbi:hypothetical protein BG005_004149 [Podila minutissima]|nr:hypothetical protein BG005_004149 [Podila minutissima]
MSSSLFSFMLCIYATNGIKIIPTISSDPPPRYAPQDAGLIFYGYTKVRDILSREYVLQITEMPRSSFNNIMSFPDIMMCSTGTRLSDSSRLLDVNNNNINITMINITAVTQQMYHDLCNKHAWLTIFSTKNQLVNVTQNEDSVYNIMLGTLPDVNEEFYSWFYVAPNYDNPFLTGKDVPHETWSDFWDNNFAISQNYTTLQIQVTNVQTYVLRKDFWGLLGETEDVPKRSVSAVGSSFFRSGASRVDIYLPKKEIHQKQIPLTSLSSGFAEWGGWFSVVWGVFYFFFGSPRLDPFGLIAMFFMSNKTKRRILKAYGPLPNETSPQNGPNNSPGARSRMSTSSTFSSISSYGSDPTLYNHQMSPTYPGQHSPASLMSPGSEYFKPGEQLTQPQHQQVQRMMDSRFRRLERMLSEYYLEMPTIEDEVEAEKASQGAMGRFWDRLRGRRRQGHTSIPDNNSYYGPPLGGHDPYHDQVPLRAFDPKSMPRES